MPKQRLNATPPDDRRPAAGRCPICGKPARTETRPFCSRRCADVDLSRWLGGVYRIPQTDPFADEPADRDETDLRQPDES